MKQVSLTPARPVCLGLIGAILGSDKVMKTPIFVVFYAVFRVIIRSSVSLYKSLANLAQHWAQPLFLGNSPRSIKDRHYSDPSQALFDEAVKWLGEQYGIR